MKLTFARIYKPFPFSLQTNRPAWGFKCEHNLCKKVELTPDNIKTAVSLSVCRLFCNEDVGTVWPKPTGDVQISNDVVKINANDIKFKTDNFKREPAYWAMAEKRFNEMQQKKLPKKYSIRSGGQTLTIEVVVESDDMGKVMASDCINHDLIFLIHSIFSRHLRGLPSESVRQGRRRCSRFDQR